MMLAPVYLEKTVVVRGSKSRFSLFFTVFRCCCFFFLPVMPFNPQKKKKNKNQRINMPTIAGSVIIIFQFNQHSSTRIWVGFTIAVDGDKIRKKENPFCYRFHCRKNLWKFNT